MRSDSRKRGVPPHLQRLIPLIAQGCSNAEIARDLGLNKHTVENYVTALIDIAECQNRLRLLIWAQQNLADT